MLYSFQMQSTSVRKQFESRAYKSALLISRSIPLNPPVSIKMLPGGKGRSEVSSRRLRKASAVPNKVTGSLRLERNVRIRSTSTAPSLLTKKESRRPSQRKLPIRLSEEN